jgi:hypothetical protein
MLKLNTVLRYLHCLKNLDHRTANFTGAVLAPIITLLAERATSSRLLPHKLSPLVESTSSDTVLSMEQHV